MIFKILKNFLKSLRNEGNYFIEIGRGSRIKKFTNLKPKCFIKVNKKYFRRLLENFEKNQLKDISVITGYKNYLFKNLNLKNFK